MEVGGEGYPSRNGWQRGVREAQARTSNTASSSGSNDGVGKESDGKVKGSDDD